MPPLRKRPASCAGPVEKKARGEELHKFHIFVADGCRKPCRICKKALNGTCVQHDDPNEPGRVKETMQKLAQSREAYQQAREELEYSRMSPAEKHWYDHFAYYKNGGPYAFETDSSDSDDNDRYLDTNDQNEEDRDDWRDYSIYYHLGCFAKCKQMAWSRKTLTEPTFEHAVAANDRDKVTALWAAMQVGSGPEVQQLLPESRGHLTEEQFQQVQSAKVELKKTKVSDLREALARNCQGLLNGKPKNVLVDAVAELKVLGALPKCPVCRGGRNGKGGNLSWNRETDSFACTGFFSAAGPQACKGPGQKHSIMRTAWAE